MSTGFPSHFIDPREKNYKWYLDWAKAAWRNWNSDVPTTMFYHASSKYKTFRAYAMGKQSINKYKPLLGVNDDKNKEESTLNIDWGVIPIYPKLRRTALGMLDKIDYNIDAAVIDPVSIAQDEDYFKTMKAKILLREQAVRANPELLESPILKPQPGEPLDMEELEIQMEGGYKNTKAMESEMGVTYIFEKNNVPEIRRRMRRDTWDFGVAGCKEWTAKDGDIKIRHVDVRNVLMGVALEPDFSDTPYVGEMRFMTLTQLAEDAGDEFSMKELEAIATATQGKYGNPARIPPGSFFNIRAFNSWRIRVLDLEFRGVNTAVYKEQKTKAGNVVFNKVDYNAQPTEEMKVMRKQWETLHRAKWVVDTDYIYDWGNGTNQVRKKSEGYSKAYYSYHFFAPDVDEMIATSISEQVISIVDQIQLAYYKLQNAINTARPKGIMIEIGGLEDIPLGKGGAKLSPGKVLKLYNHQGTLVYRKVDKQGRMSNYKPIDELEGGMGKDAGEYWSVITNNIDLLRNIVGLNDLTDASTPGERTLTTVAQIAYQSSNNALSNIVIADRYIVEKLANSVAYRLQDVLKYKEVEGYVRSLGDGSVKFFKMSKHVANCELGIFLKDRPTDAQRQALIERMKMFEAQQILEPEDIFLIENTQNVKLAQKILSHRVKKRKAEKIAEAQRQQEMNAQVQIQSAQAAEQAKQQTIQMEKDLDLRNRTTVADTEGSWFYKTKMIELEIAKMQLGSKEKIEGAKLGQEIGESTAQVVANDNLGFDPNIFADAPVAEEEELPVAMPYEEEPMMEEAPQEMAPFMPQEQPTGFSPLL
jgi:hypothetical protein